MWKEKHEEKANYDLIRAIMVYISQNQKDFGNRLMGLLYTLFKGNGNAASKKEVLRDVYHVDLDADEMKEMDDMCNLSVGIYNHGRSDGRVEGRLEGRLEGRAEEGKKIIIRLLQNHMSVEFIAENTDRPVEYIRQIAKEQNLPC